jgi:hypothetical protein
MTRICLLPLLLLTNIFAQAQHETGLHFMRQTWQSNLTNPALVPAQRFAIGLPGIRNTLIFEGPTYNQIVIKQNGEPVIDIDRFISYLDPENIIRDDLDIPTLSLAVRFSNLTLTAGHSLKYHAFFKYPKSLPQLIWQGNAQFIGQTADLSNELQLTGYHELAIGAAYKLGKVTLGVKGKFLNGIADASTDRDHHSASLYTDPDIYQITLDGDYLLHTSHTFEYEDYQHFDVNFDFGNFTFDQFFSKNAGFAFDLGARLETDHWDVAASLIDVGSIHWEDGVTNYTATKSYEYDGLDFSQALTGGEVNFEDALDTLEQLFRVEKSAGSYTNHLPRKMYLSILYKLNDTWSFGGAAVNESFRGVSAMTYAVGANAALYKFLTLGATYAITENNFDNIGLNTTLKLGPVQVFATTDNIIAAVRPGDSKNFNVRIGGNLLFK